MEIKKADEKIRLIFFSFGILEQGGGFEDFLIQTAPELIGFENVFETAIVTTTPKVTERLQKMLSVYFFKRHSVSSIYREPLDDITKRLGDARYFRVSNLFELVSILNLYDYVYVKNEVLELAIIKLIRRKLKCKVIVGVHTPIFYPYTPSLSAKAHNLLYTHRFYNWLLDGVDQIKVNTADDKKYMVDTFARNNVNVVHQAFEVKEGRITTNKSKKLRVLFVGRITEQKGIDILLEVISKLIASSKFNSFIFRVAGSGEPKLELKLNELSDRYGNFNYLGHVEHSKIKDLYNWTDVTIVPSKYETLNKTAVESSVAGKIVISSDIAGPREVIDNKKTGYLIDPSAANFYKVLLELLRLKQSAPEKLYAMGVKAQNKIASEFSSVKVYREFYEQLLNK